jgi:hypothetical protein
VTRRRQPLHPVRQGWTVQRATGAGAIAGIVGLAMLLFYPALPALNRPFILVCAIAAFCGLSILWITVVDRYRRGRRRGIRMAPLRAFDICFGLLLALPSLWMIQVLLGDR